MRTLEPKTQDGRAGISALVSAPDRAVIAFDFDGVLSPIVDDPTAAQSHPSVISPLVRIGRTVGAIAIITGRPVSFILSRVGMEEVLSLPNLTIFGQYGRERWEPSGENWTAPRDSRIDAARDEIGQLLGRRGTDPGIRLEDKDSAIAVHTRRADHPEQAFAALTTPLESIAARLGLQLEPGKMVLELRPPGVDKGDVLRSFAREWDPSCVVYAGDDLGDLSAFDAVEALRDSDVPGVKICSGSSEAVAVAERADLVVDGPVGMARLLEDLALALHK